MLVILNLASPVSLLGRAVAPSDKTGFWSNILQKPAGLQPLKVFLKEGQRAQHTISPWTVCHNAEFEQMWYKAPNYHPGGPFPKVYLIKDIPPA